MLLLADNDVAVGESVSGGPGVLESLAADWRRLCDEGTSAQDPFCRPEWSIPYAYAYERQDIAAFTARVDGRLAATLPLVRERGFLWGIPVRMLRPAADISRFDLVLSGSENERAAAVEALRRCVREDTSWDVVELARVPKSGALFRIMSEAEKDGFLTGFQRMYRSPVLSLSGLSVTGEESLAGGYVARVRCELRRKTRRLSAVDFMAGTAISFGGGYSGRPCTR
jgi:hypothetical protein